MAGKKQAEVITILKTVPFFPDVLDLEAELWPDGAGVNVKEPSMPSPLWRFPSKVMDGMAGAYDQEGLNETPICKSTMQTYKTEATRIATHPTKTRTISIRFPSGVTCNNNHFNDECDGGKLMKRIVTFTATHPSFQQDGTLLEFPFSMAFWRFVVDGSERLARVPDAPDFSLQVKKMINGVGSLYLSDNQMAFETDKDELIEQYRQELNSAREEAMRSQQAAASKKRQQQIDLEQRLADAEYRANLAAQEAAQAKQEQQRNTAKAESYWKRMAEKEAYLIEEKERLEQQLRQSQHTGPSQSEAIRANAQHLIDEANRREAEQAAAAAATNRHVAVHPRTGEQLTESSVHDLVREFADARSSTYEEVMEWISEQDVKSEQQVVDLLFSS